MPYQSLGLGQDPHLILHFIWPLGIGWQLTELVPEHSGEVLYRLEMQLEPVNPTRALVWSWPNRGGWQMRFEQSVAYSLNEVSLHDQAPFELPSGTVIELGTVRPYFTTQGVIPRLLTGQVTSLDELEPEIQRYPNGALARAMLAWSAKSYPVDELDDFTAALYEAIVALTGMLKRETRPDIPSKWKEYAASRYVSTD